MPRLQPGEDGRHHTYCRLCEAQCGLIAEVQSGVITRIGPDRDHPVSRGHLCVKAPGMLQITYDEDRWGLGHERGGRAYGGSNCLSPLLQPTWGGVAWP